MSFAISETEIRLTILLTKVLLGLKELVSRILAKATAFVPNTIRCRKLGRLCNRNRSSRQKIDGTCVRF